MAQGAIHGLGAALLPRFLIERELAERRLIPAFGGPVKSLGSYFLVWPKDTARRPALTSFHRWLIEEGQSNSFAAARLDR
jgi:DNA-binding transcriptional LysR family regulator